MNTSLSATAHLPVRTILVVDDDDGVRLVVKRLLERAGFDVQTACDGLSGIASVQAGIPQLCAVLVDLSMPDMSGDRVIAELACHIPDVPLILMSGYQADIICQQSIHEGVMHFLQKPFSRETLHSVLASAIDRQADGEHERVVGL